MGDSLSYLDNLLSLLNGLNFSIMLVMLSKMSLRICSNMHFSIPNPISKHQVTSPPQRFRIKQIKLNL